MQIYPQVALSVTAILAERLEKANQRAGVDFISLSRFAQLIPKPEAAAPARPPTGRAGGVDSNSAQAATIDLLQSDLIRELQLAESVQDTAETKQDLMSASENAPTIRLANSILGLAIKQGASDIHIEPMEADVTVRFRTDGVLQVVRRLPKRCSSGSSRA